MFQHRVFVAAHDVKYYPYFDYLRALAAFGVFVAHADRSHFLPAEVGNACVQVFFALSGFLIGGILLRSSAEDLPRFFFNRAARIWIPYAIAILILALVTGIKQGFADPKVSEFFFYMVTFVYNWFGPPQLAEFVHRMPLDGTANHFWSICVEEQFYLIAPFLILFLPRAFLFVGLAAATWLSPNYFASISMGVLLAIVGPRVWIVTACGFAGLCLAVTGPYIAAAALVSTAIVGALANLRGPQTTLGKIAGGASYPFYLNHWLGLFAINALVKLGANIWLADLIGAAVAVSFAVVHFLVIDRTIAARRGSYFSLPLGIALAVLSLTLFSVGMTGGVYMASR